MKHFDEGTTCQWRYPKRDPAPKGVKVNLLTIGNHSVVGVWHKDGGFKAWHPLLKRDKEYEEANGLM